MNSLIDVLNQSAHRYADKTALQIKEGGAYFSLSFSRLRDLAADAAKGLKAQGIEPGDRVAILADNHPYWGVAFFSILFAQGAVVPIDAKLEDQSILNILNHSECRAVFVSQRHRETAALISQKAAARPAVIALEGAETENAMSLPRLIRLPAASSQTLTEPDPRDTAIILYTSGTTGSAKGVALSHDNVASNALTVAPLFPFTPDDHLIGVLPLCHTYAITADFVVPLSSGSTITYLETLKGPALIERMREVEATILIAVPALIQLMHHQIAAGIGALPAAKRTVFRALRAVSALCLKVGYFSGPRLFRSLRNKLSPRIRFIVSGGAPIDPRIIREFFYWGIPVYQGYGLTETSPILSVNYPGCNRIGSVGRPIPDVEIRLENGEIKARGPNIMKGYFRNPEATEEVLKEGWFHTGDLGRLDPEGFLYISGRLKNVIVTRGGKNIYPEELEEELQRSPFIKEASVVGVGKTSGGFSGDEQVYALIVPDAQAVENSGIKCPQGQPPSPALNRLIAGEIKAANDRMAEYKRIRDFEIWEELPKTTTLKIKRKDVLEILKGKGLNSVGLDKRKA